MPPPELLKKKGMGGIDPVMLMDNIRRNSGGTVYSRDVKSAVNSLRRG